MSAARMDRNRSLVAGTERTLRLADVLSRSFANALSSFPSFENDEGRDEDLEEDDEKLLLMLILRLNAGRSLASKACTACTGQSRPNMP